MAHSPGGDFVCASCGFRNASNVRFCVGCGRLLRRREVEAKPRSAPWAEAPSRPGAPTPGASARPRSLTIHLLFLLVGLLAGYLLAQWVDLPSLF